MDMSNLFVLAQAAPEALGAAEAEGLMDCAESLFLKHESWRIIIATLVVVLASLMARKLVAWSGKMLQKRSQDGFAGVLLDKFAMPLQLLVLLVGCWLGAQIAGLGDVIERRAVRQVFMMLYVVDLAAFIHQLVEALWVWRKRVSGENGSNTLAMGLCRRSALVVIWLGALFFVLQNVMHYNVSAMVAGAGVAGLAIAFAAQNTVANLFGALSLVVDKPFIVGDRIRCNDAEGMVTSIGLRSTRLRSLDGQLHVIPNHLLADSVVVNFSNRKWFREVLDIGLIYESTPEQLEQAMTILKEILHNRPLLDPERPAAPVFNQMRDWSLNIRVVLWYDTSDWGAFQQDLSEVNLEIFRRFTDAGLSFAYPTSTTYIAGGLNK